MAKATKSARAARQGVIRHGGMAVFCLGLAMAGLGVFMAFSFMTADVGVDVNASAESCWTGLLGAWLAYGGIYTLGKSSAMLLALLVVCWGLHVAKNTCFLTTWPQVFGGALILGGFALGISALSERYDMHAGGLLAIYASPPAILYFGRWGLVLASTGIVIVGILLSFGEAAIGFVHQTVFIVRDLFLGLFGLGTRLRDMIRLLFNPRLAVANGGAGQTMAREIAPSVREQTSRDQTAKTRRGRDTARPSARAMQETEFIEPGAAAKRERDSFADLSAEETREVEKDGREDSSREDSSIVAQPPEEASNFKEWKPKDSFHSRFLNLDPSGDIPTMQPPMQSVDASIAPPAPARAKADVIMDVEALTEESDQPDQLSAPGPMETNELAERESDSHVSDVLAGLDADDDDSAAADKQDSDIERLLDRALEREPSRTEQTSAAPERKTPPPAPSPRPETRSPESRRPESRDTERKAPIAGCCGLENYSLPPIEMLDAPPPPVVEDRSVIEGKAKILEQTLAEFKIEGRVVHIERGPRVTMYEISLAPGIRLSKVTSLQDNIAMQLQAESVRIIAPIPGKNTIGIEIPNTCKELVALREIVNAVNREKRRQALPVCLGKDVSGQALVADLARMPHLLIAGATGSGKSVCINSIILSVMMCCKPDEAQMILVDPKVVELSRFKDIPHLMSPVITDMKRAVSVLDWICQKMDERYEQMSQVSVNNIAKFNALGEAGIRERLDEFMSLEDIEMFPKKMPYMVVIIDELADLMMVAGKEVEHHITRLAAKSRAVGIHLILATQRPSVDVITGLIKANMPCRIAFQVASRVDSRTILDGNGAETLLGQGDMLYLPPGVGKLTRAQGVFVSDEELFRVVDFVKSEAGPQYHEDLMGPVIGGGGGKVDIASFDDLFMESGEAIIENQRGSVSLLQRKFGIGYGRASRIIDQLESVGLLGPFRDGKSREILLTIEEFRSKFGKAGQSADAWDDDDDDGGMAGLRDDEREREQLDWGSDVEDD